MQVRFNDRVGFDDDTALNGLKIICRDPYYPAIFYSLIVHKGIWGVWKVVKYSPFVEKTYVCGVEVKYDAYKNSTSGFGIHAVDNTALNGIKLKMCVYN